MPSLKTTIIRALILAIVMSAPLLLADNGIGVKQLPAKRSAPVADRTSNAELGQKKSALKQGFQQATWSGQAPTSQVRRYKIYQDSIILQQGDSHTILPRHSIIYLPDTLQQKVVNQPRGSFVPWPQFYLKNRNWLFTHEIHLKQAQGITPLKKGIETQFKRINRIVIALHQNNPISVLSSPAEQ